MDLTTTSGMGPTVDEVSTTQQDCCNMCTNHPDCGSFTWTADNTCTLYSGSPETKLLADTDTAYATTWSGCQSGDIC